MRDEAVTRTGSELRGRSVGCFDRHERVKHMLIEHIRELLGRILSEAPEQIESKRAVLQGGNRFLIELDDQ